MKSVTFPASMSPAIAVRREYAAFDFAFLHSARSFFKTSSRSPAEKTTSVAAHISMRDSFSYRYPVTSS